MEPQLRKLKVNTPRVLGQKYKSMMAMQRYERTYRLTPAQVTMLKALTIAGKDGLTIGHLSQAAGYKSREASIKVFKKIGLLIAEYLELELPEAGSAQNDGAAQVLAFSHIESEDEPAIWIMHQELRDAVRSVL